MFKKIANPLIAVILAIAASGAIAGIAAAKTLPRNTLDVMAGDKVNLNIQDAGVMTRGGSTFEGELELARTSNFSADEMTAQNIHWVAPLLKVDLNSNDKGMSDDARLHGNTFIYFELGSHLDRAGAGGMLAIYKFDATRNVWVRLPSRYVTGSKTSPAELVTRAIGVGTYGVGWVR
jgi:hypothetical protein